MLLFLTIPLTAHPSHPAPQCPLCSPAQAPMGSSATSHISSLSLLVLVQYSLCSALCQECPYPNPAPWFKALWLLPPSSVSSDFFSTYILILHQSVGYLVLNKGAHHLSCCHKILLLHYVLPAPTKSSLMEGCREPAQWAQPLLRKELKIFFPTCSYQHPRRSPRFTWGQGVGAWGIRTQSES